MDGLRYLPSERVWVGTAAIGVNEQGEVVVAGSPSGPDPALLEQAEDATSRASELVELAVEHLNSVSNLGEDAAWFPDGMRFTGFSDDGEPELIIELSTEVDFYALWSVTIRTGRQQPWVSGFERREQ